MKIIVNLYLLFISFSVFSQFQYEANKENPYGKYNPQAPKQVLDYKDLIGKCNCYSENRKPDGKWSKPVKMTWEWKYIMNGTAVEDKTLKEDGNHSGSIRQFHKDSLKWFVHYYSSKSISSNLKTWSGNKNKKGNIVLYSKQKGPNGMSGFSRLTFYEINKKGYKWIGEWINESEKIIYPFWKITCTRKNNN